MNRKAVYSAMASGLLAATLAAGATSAQSEDDADVTVGFSIYSFATPYGKGVEKGALDAGSDLGVTVPTAGTPGFDLVALSQIVQDQLP